MLLKPAGSLIEPPVSVPVAEIHISDATDTADPLDDPPGTYFLSHGFLVGPKSEFSPLEPWAQASRLVFPMITAPASLIFLTTVASYGGI